MDGDHGLLVEKFRGKKLSKFFMIFAVVVSLGVLGIFKYADFAIENINAIFKTDIALLKIGLPIGISFYTFQTLSYVIDLYRGNTKVQKNPISFMAYVSMFPQLIAGPIVRYSDVAEELDKRTISFENIAYGINRFIIGLGKKVLIANVLGEFCNIVKTSEEQSVIFVWAYAIAMAVRKAYSYKAFSALALTCRSNSS